MIKVYNINHLSIIFDTDASTHGIPEDFVGGAEMYQLCYKPIDGTIAIFKVADPEKTMEVLKTEFKSLIPCDGCREPTELEKYYYNKLPLV